MYKDIKKRPAVKTDGAFLRLEYELGVGEGMVNTLERENLWLYLILYFAFISLLAFGAFALDKHFAKNQLWRVSERKLLLLALLGGAASVIVAQYILRHKTYKQPFRSLLLGALFVNLFFILLCFVPAVREGAIAYLEVLLGV